MKRERALSLNYRFEKVSARAIPPSNTIEGFGYFAAQMVKSFPALTPRMLYGRAEKMAGGILDPALLCGEAMAWHSAGELHRLRSVNFESQPLLEYSYDQLGRVIQLNFLGSLRERYNWTERGQLASITHRDAETTEFTYHDNGLLSRIRYPDRSMFSYSYDAQGRLAKVVYPDNVNVTYAYDSEGRLSHVSSNQCAFEFEWGDGSKVRAARFRTHSESHSLDLAAENRSFTGLFTTESNQENTYNSILGLWRYGSAASLREIFAFPGERFVEQMNDASTELITWSRSGLRSYRFDRHQALAAVLNADGTTTLYKRLLPERAVLQIAPSGIGVLYYDQHGFLTADRDARGAGAAYRRFRSGQLKSVKAGGESLSFSWHNAHDLNKVSVSDGFRAAFRYEKGRPSRFHIDESRMSMDIAVCELLNIVWTWQVNAPARRLLDRAFRE